MSNTATVETVSKTAVQSRQAHALATRLEEGARALAAFATSLSDADWHTRMPHDGRTFNVIVHHVASVYPVEIQLAQAVASGTPVTGLTMDDIHAMNAKHAVENAGATKQAALELLAVNSAAAAAAIRALTDEQLATAVPVSLYENAPLTCQFVLEDHAVRHSYHHLFLMQRALRG